MPKVVQNSVYLLFDNNTYIYQDFYSYLRGDKCFRFYVQSCMVDDFKSCVAVVLTVGKLRYIEKVYQNNVRLRLHSKLDLTNYKLNLLNNVTTKSKS